MTSRHLQSSQSQSRNASAGLLPLSLVHQDPGRSHGLGSGSFFQTRYPVVREDVDVVSARFRPLDSVSVSVRSGMPSVMRLYLDTGMDGGGSLTLSLQANEVAPCDLAQPGHRPSRQFWHGSGVRGPFRKQRVPSQLGPGKGLCLRKGRPTPHGSRGPGPCLRVLLAAVCL